MEKTLAVKGMHCNSCKIIVEEVSMEVEGIQKASADFEKGKVELSFKDESALPKVKKAIEELGYKVID